MRDARELVDHGVPIHRHETRLAWRDKDGTYYVAHGHKPAKTNVARINALMHLLGYPPDRFLKPTGKRHWRGWHIWQRDGEVVTSRCVFKLRTQKTDS